MSDATETERRPEDDGRIVRVRSAREPEHPATQPSRPPGSANDPDHRLRVRDTLIEKIIRGAQERGAFDELPYQGERLPPTNDEHAGDMASAFRILRNADAAPPWIEADKLVRSLLAERDRLFERASRSGPLSRPRYRDQLRELVREHNRAVFSLNHQAPTARQHRQPLDLATELAALEARWNP
jgi:DnaJ-like protein